MTRVLQAAGFTPLEIESVLWAKGDVGAAPAPLTKTAKRKQLWDAIIGRISTAIVSGLILGGVFVYYSSGLESAAQSGADATSATMNDYRTPKEAYYQPFMWGFIIGAIGGLILGDLVYNPAAKDSD